MRYSHIAFDLDGTLIDTNGPYLRAVQRRLQEELGFHKELWELSSILGVPGRIALAELGFPDVESAHEVIGRYFYEYAGEIRAFEGIEETLSALQGKGIRLGLVTSKGRARLEREFFPLPVSRYFPDIVCAEDTALHKPEPAPMLCYLSRTGADPARTLYVGDSPNDLAMCRAAGVGCVLVTWGSFQRDRDPSVRYLSHPRELSTLLQL